jgi:hypothetical protein
MLDERFPIRIGLELARPRAASDRTVLAAILAPPRPTLAFQLRR